MPAALLSRFDLLFILIDKQDSNKDKKLAEHVVYTHQNSCAREVDRSGWFAPDAIRAYLTECKETQTHMPPSLTE